MRVARSDGVLFETIDGIAMLVDAHGRELFTLNAVGTMVWEALPDADDATRLAERLHPRLRGVERDRLERDITRFLDELRAAGLVVDRA